MIIRRKCRVGQDGTSTECRTDIARQIAHTASIPRRSHALRGTVSRNRNSHPPSIAVVPPLRSALPPLLPMRCRPRSRTRRGHSRPRGHRADVEPSPVAAGPCRPLRCRALRHMRDRGRARTRRHRMHRPHGAQRNLWHHTRRTRFMRARKWRRRPSRGHNRQDVLPRPAALRPPVRDDPQPSTPGPGRPSTPAPGRPASPPGAPPRWNHARLQLTRPSGRGNRPDSRD